MFLYDAEILKVQSENTPYFNGFCYDRALSETPTDIKYLEFYNNGSQLKVSDYNYCFIAPRRRCS